MSNLDEALQHVLGEVRSRLGDTIKGVEQQGVERIAQLDADQEATREPAEAVEQAIQEEVPERRAAAEQAAAQIVAEAEARAREITADAYQRAAAVCASTQVACPAIS